jgi:hypothetical protein
MKMDGMIGLAVLLALGGAAPAAAQAPGPKAAIEAIREYQQTLGMTPTGNFHKHSRKAVAAYRCYYTGKLELPESYDELRFEKGSEKGCPLDPEKYDIFFYPIEAVASGNMPVTSALAGAAPERLLMVVLHEDFHEYHEHSKLPAAATEAASTLMGFITAAGFVADRAEQTADIAARMAREADLFLAKAQMVNRYREEVADLCRAANAGEVSKQAALHRKQQLFGDLERDCRSLPAEPASFDSCPGALNNAGLAFDYTYTKHYPLLHQLYESRQRDLRTTLTSVQEILAMPLQTEDEFVAAIREQIAMAQQAAE